MLDQSIWSFSFFMACCERIALLHSCLKKNNRGLLRWPETQCLSDATVSLSVTQCTRAAKPEWGCERNVVFFTDTQVPQLSVFVRRLFSPWKMTIIFWGEFTNKMNGNVDSYFDSTWQLLVFWSLNRLPPHRLPVASHRGRDLGCNCHALRAADGLFTFPKI